MNSPDSPGEAIRRRDRSVRRILLIEGLANLAVLLAKGIVGVATGSLAIVGDAIHSGGDLANNIVALLVMKRAAEPPDREHPYGHRKYETLAVFILASLLTVTAFQIVLAAIRNTVRDLHESSWSLPTMLGVLAVNTAISLWENYQARRLNSAILAADARHTFSDVLVTVAVIVGWQVSAAGYPWVDSACAIFVAGMVMYLAYGLFARAVPVLVDRIAVEPERLASVIAGVEGVVEVRSVRSRWAGDEIVVDATVAVDGNLRMSEAHDISDRVEAALLDRFGIRDSTVHVEPAGS